MIAIYALFKLLQVVAVVVFLGNASLGLFWVAHAESTGDARMIGHAMRGIIRADRWFTMPGIVLIVGGGVAAAVSGGLKMLSVGWILGAILMFGLSGLLFGMALSPLQRQIVAATDANADFQATQAMLRRWHVLGWLALLPLSLAVAMMVLKWPA
ncbi:DUF2269 family protein [Dokdonella immobilis]|uniref:Uncharacterized membrane protein n=1 Tax=Dokdonella immobilis TaxID=578942 RepID=A0A1I4VT06_9GAMM|nr:DUF2269 family protein [Dokdonella immobilis]SFN04177.1 Uncharacterized membrane protein [Dokdonella immobilis]